MKELETITIEGFRSIKAQTLTLNRLNLVIGGNGVGKSNLVNSFSFLHGIYIGQLQMLSVSRNPATYFFHGPKLTPQIRFDLRFVDRVDRIANEYEVKIAFGDAKLFLESERVGYQQIASYPKPKYDYLMPSASQESVLLDSKDKNAQYVSSDIASYRAYHFHDTSRTAGVKQQSKIDNNRALAFDASNLAAMLYLFKQTHPDHFNLIESTIKQIAPFFDGFIVEPLRANPEMIKLEWRERGSDDYFDGHSLSDGTLRFMCLATLLLQPDAPRLILLDEPELGLHPAAINILASMLRQASVSSQILLATQSVTLINQFQPEDVVVAERGNGATAGATEFRRLKSETYADWMEEYSLGEMWEKNLIGGRP
jgi:predicted ATPase